MNQKTMKTVTAYCTRGGTGKRIAVGREWEEEVSVPDLWQVIGGGGKGCGNFLFWVAHNIVGRHLYCR